MPPVKRPGPARYMPDAVRDADCTRPHPDTLWCLSAGTVPDPRTVASDLGLYSPAGSFAARAARQAAEDSALLRALARIIRESPTVHGFDHFSPVMNGCILACCGDHLSIGFILRSPWQKSMKEARLFISIQRHFSDPTRCGINDRAAHLSQFRGLAAVKI